MTKHPENEHVPDSDVGDERLSEKDRSYSPASDRDMAAKQDDQTVHSPDVDPSQVKVLPGTGSPDDVGDVEVDPKDLHVPGRED